MTSGRCHRRRAASPTPPQTSNSLKDPVSTARTAFLSAGERRDASAPQPGGSRRGGPTSESAPSGGPSGLVRERGVGMGGSAEGGASPLAGSRILAGTGYPEPRSLSSPLPLPCYLVTSSPLRRRAAPARSPPLPHRTPRQPPSYRRDQRAGWEAGGAEHFRSEHRAARPRCAQSGSLGPVYQREAPLGARAASRPRRSTVVSAPRRDPRDGSWTWGAPL